jgi:16S rRNA (cytidine1402-2'-O)-methyltransferase
VPISDGAGEDYIPAYNSDIIRSLKIFIAEDAKIARKNLKTFGYPVIANAEIYLLNEHTRKSEIPALLENLVAGENVGLMSDAGCPGIADPGAEIVALAHQKGIRVVPLAGPSSIVLSIMASGFNGQNFAFTGYLPVDKVKRRQRIRELENMAVRHGQAQFFIETPYRNVQLFDELLKALAPQTLLFIGRNITAPDELLLSKPVSEWHTTTAPDVHKVPVVFGIFK